jgi:hypothetical protein
VLIEAAGKTWIVEEQDLTRTFWASGERLSGVTFRSLDYASDELYVRWVLTPEHLTDRLAQELFEIAGTRAWRDPRDSRVYEVQLDTTGSLRNESGKGPAPLEVIRFRAGAVEAATPWTLAKPLGWATDAELMSLLDRAFRGRPPHELPTV